MRSTMERANPEDAYSLVTYMPFNYGKSGMDKNVF